MKRKITSLLTLFLLVASSVFAQYTTDGLYTIQCVNSSKYMSGGTPGSPMPMIASVTDDAKFYVVQNASDNTKYNIISMDQNYLAACSPSGYGTLIENTEANRNTSSSGALLSLIDEGANPYRIEGYKVDVLQAMNGYRSGGAQVGLGTSTNTYYEWNLVRIGDMPAAGAPVVSITSPESGTEVLPSATVDIEATASALDGATVTAVEFLVDDVKVGDGVYNATSEVWEYTWAGSAVEATYAVTAKATSSTALVDTSDAVSVVVATSPASVSLTWPSGATTILPNKQVTLEADATAATGETITKVEFFEGENLLGEDTTAPYTLDVDFSTIATFSITAKVTDSGNNTETSAAVDLTTSLTTEIQSLYLNFETGVGDASSDWSWKGTAYTAAVLTNVSYDVSKARSAANGVLEIDFAATSSTASDNLNYQVEGIAAKPSTGMFYIRMHYAADNTTLIAGPTLWSSALQPTPGTATANADGTFKTKTWNKDANSMGADGSTVTIYPALRMDANSTTDKAYFDDVVLYYDPYSSGTDGTAPTAPTNVAAPTVSANEIILTWDEGMDVGIGIDSTYIFRTTTSEEAPALVDYVGYAVDNVAAGLSAPGNWTVVGVVPLGTKTFTDNSISDGNTTGYKYAVVHKDYAYNYSDAAVVTNGVVTGLNKTIEAAFKCYGTKGAVQMSTLPLGETVSVYSLSGLEVYSAKVSVSTMTVNLPQGLYIVKAQNETQKVVVK